MKNTYLTLGIIIGVLAVVATTAYAALTFNVSSIVSDTSLTITGAGNSTWDIGANTLSLQTTNNGAITTGGGLFTVGGNIILGSGGGTISKHLTGTSSITFGVIVSSTCKTANITVTNATSTNSTATVTPEPVANGIETASTTWSAWISAPSTVSVVACNPRIVNSVSIAAQTWRADVWQH